MGWQESWVAVEVVRCKYGVCRGRGAVADAVEHGGRHQGSVEEGCAAGCGVGWGGLVGGGGGRCHFGCGWVGLLMMIWWKTF